MLTQALAARHIDRSAGPTTIAHMSIGDIKQQLERLQPDERRHLLAFLISLEGGADDRLRSELTRKIDDRDPKHWITLEDAKAHLGDT